MLVLYNIHPFRVSNSIDIALAYNIIYYLNLILNKYYCTLNGYIAVVP